MISASIDLVEALAQNIPPDARVLEVGTGSGRIAVPLLQRGLDLVGLDLALVKLHRLACFVDCTQLVQADAVRLPFSASSFDVVVMVRVMHLIARPQELVQDVRRVLRPGGAFVHDSERIAPDSIYVRIRDAWQAIMVGSGWLQSHQSRSDHSVAELMEAMGASNIPIELAPIQHQTTPARELERIGDRLRAGVWHAPADQHASLLSELESWTAEEFGALDREWCYRQKLGLQIWRFQHE